jgi:hypothetical protein
MADMETIRAVLPVEYFGLFYLWRDFAEAHGPPWNFLILKTELILILS